MTQALKKPYDLEERTAQFSEKIIVFCKMTKQDVISKPIINQLIRSATSIGAKYMEANGASSKKDFRNKIYICKKEAQELTLIFRKITTTLKNSDIGCHYFSIYPHTFRFVLKTKGMGVYFKGQAAHCLKIV